LRPETESPARFCPGVSILVNGRAFAVTPSPWRRLGAEGAASDAKGAVALAAQLTSAS